MLSTDTFVALMEPTREGGSPSRLEGALRSAFPQVERFCDPGDCLRELPRTGPVVFLVDRGSLEQSELLWLILLAESRRGPVLLLDEGPMNLVLERAGVAAVLQRASLEGGGALLPDYLGLCVQSARGAHEQRELSAEVEELRQREATQRKESAALRRETEHFVRDALHEFRTPLTSMHEFASILHDGLGGPLTDKQHEYLEYVLSGTHDMLELFDDFRDSIRLRLDDLPTMLGTHELKEIVEAALAEAETDRVTFEVEMPHRGAELYADAGQLRTCLARVLSYAAKSTPRGGRVKLRARSIDKSCEFSILNNGPTPTEGDARLMREGVFTNHLQRKSVTKVFGIGIELARALISLNGGQLELTADGEQGSVLSFRVPKHKPAPAGRASARAVA